MNCRLDPTWSPFAEQLSSFDPRWLYLHNRLHRIRKAWHGECAGQAIGVRWGSVAEPDATTIELLLGLGEEGDAAAIRLHLPEQALHALGMSVALDFQTLPGAMLLELALLSLIEPLERLSGQPVRFIDRADPAHAGLAAQPCPLHLITQVQFDGSSMSVVLHLSAKAGEQVVQWFDQHIAPAPHVLPDLRLWLAVEAGEADLSVGELRSLNPGDVVMLDPWPTAQVRLVLNRRLSARAGQDGTTLKLLETLMSVNFSEEFSVSEAPSMSETSDGQSLDSRLDDLPLKMICQAGSVELTLAQLRELGEGSLLSFTEQRQDSVDLMVNGRRVGLGQLVRIGPGLGVRVLSIATS
ncbi:type III secretion system cytoplasmic ring protein SctQ [Pseudomonas hefeiensis]|uniref:Type III secretion system cytoplasmic ring protein SctQ n=1 Tax=Pseudomonas hefeiensis TaxID=2738125 RepID=A0ABY9GH73_9PSED|nr:MULTISPECIES: type III secretion system cytoplasmic ring protein SctQ [unclassified Pseudomonas]WLH14897.1 type III secretion system cytoplasmic ring protein SctQ [Pseudomonas sp. FP205]WLH97946.1 type III secretion system cytoplasmic ring protein SctQ [Pseudomonas sp. FP53]WLI42221.1 type III secretion system cytoplasmic ring protein SctQ [Pseudomonas sp. FP821]